MTSKMTSEKCNEPRSEEVCGSGRKFQLVGKRSVNGSSTTRTNVVSFAQLVQMLSCCKCPLREDSYMHSICSKTQIIPALNNDPRTVKSHCSDFLPF